MRGLLRILPIVVTILGLVVLAFVGGAVAGLNEVWPAKQLHNAWLGFKALTEQRRQLNEGDRYVGGLAEAERTTAKGVTVYNKAKAFEGLTLYTSGHDQVAMLIDMEGKVVHEWRTPFREVWQDGNPFVKNPLPDSRIFYRTAKALPDGSLLAVYESVGDTPYGYGLAKLAKDGSVEWTYDRNAHHDIDIAPDGRILVLDQEIQQDDLPPPRPEVLEPPRMEDFLAILSPDGEVLKRFSLLDAMMNSPWRDYFHMLSFYIPGTGDVMHTNSVEYVTAEKARVFPFAKEGQVLISIRELGTLAVVDPETETITWATKGFWVGQHDPDILENGDLLLFDNNGVYGATHGSRVVEFDPKTFEVVWSYGAPDKDEPLESVVRSGQERLPNGNTLIEESNAGRLVEVTRDGEIVWEYINPERGGEDKPRVAVIMLGGRYAPDYFTTDMGG